MVQPRKLLLRLRKVPRFVWRLSILGCMVLFSAVAWWYPPTHAWLGAQLGVAAASSVTIPADATTTALADRVATLEQKVADAQQAVTNDAAKMTALQTDFQDATSQVAASNAALQEQTAEMQSLVSQVQGITSGSSPASVSGTPPPAGKISINTASVSQLDTLPGIGPTYAQRIVDYRTANGPFQSIDDLTNVSGIGSATLDKIRDLIEL